MNPLRAGLLASGLALSAALCACAVEPYGYDGGVGYYGGVYAPYGYEYGGWGGDYRVGPPRGGERGGFRGSGGRPDGAGVGHGGGGPRGGGAPGIPGGSRGGGGGHR